MRNVLLALMLAAAAGPAFADGCKLNALTQLPVTMQGRRAMVTTQIEGADAHLFIDTGAFFSLLTPDAVRKFKLGMKAGTVEVKGLTGYSYAGVATARTLGSPKRPIRDVDFLVNPLFNEPGVDGVIGENILGGVDAEYDFGNGVLRLWRAEGCGRHNLAYWSQGAAGEAPLGRTDEHNRQIQTDATLNGHKIKVMLDSGSPNSILDVRAAARAGITPDSPGVISAGVAEGLSGKHVQTWIAPVDSFGIAGEEIKNTRLRMGQTSLEGVDMLLGADFFLSHRIYVSRAYSAIFLTYNGGPVFRLDRPAQAPAAPPGGPGQPPQAPATQTAEAGSPYSDTPKDAAGFARRAAASMSRAGYAEALADLTRAMELDPKNADYPYRRARVQLALRHPILAVTDLDVALKLKPDFAEALSLRGRLKLVDKDMAGAKADYEAAAAVDPEAWLRAAGDLEQAGDFTDAIAYLDKWIAANPHHDQLGLALNMRCWARGMANVQLNEALSDCNTAVRLSHSAPAMLDSRGLIHLRLGQYDAAISDYDAALKLQPKMAWSLYGRGVAKQHKGLKADGDADLKAASEIAPRLADEAKRIGLAS